MATDKWLPEKPAQGTPQPMPSTKPTVAPGGIDQIDLSNVKLPPKEITGRPPLGVIVNPDGTLTDTRNIRSVAWTAGTPDTTPVTAIRNDADRSEFQVSTPQDLPLASPGNVWMAAPVILGGRPTGQITYVEVASENASGSLKVGYQYVYPAQAVQAPSAPVGGERPWGVWLKNPQDEYIQVAPSQVAEHGEKGWLLYGNPPPLGATVLPSPPASVSTANVPVSGLPFQGQVNLATYNSALSALETYKLPGGGYDIARALSDGVPAWQMEAAFGPAQVASAKAQIEANREAQLTAQRAQQEAQRQTEAAAKARAEFNATHVKLDSGEWVNKAEFEAMPIEARAALLEKGTKGYREWQAQKQADFERDNVRLDTGEHVNRAEFNAMPVANRAKLLEKGTKGYREWLAQQQPAQAETPAVGIGPDTPTASDGSVDEAAIEQAESPLNAVYPYPQAKALADIERFKVGDGYDMGRALAAVGPEALKAAGFTDAQIAAAREQPDYDALEAPVTSTLPPKELPAATGPRFTTPIEATAWYDAQFEAWLQGDLTEAQLAEASRHYNAESQRLQTEAAIAATPPGATPPEGVTLRTEPQARPVSGAQAPGGTSELEWILKQPPEQRPIYIGPNGERIEGRDWDTLSPGKAHEYAAATVAAMQRPYLAPSAADVAKLTVATVGGGIIKPELTYVNNQPVLRFQWPDGQVTDAPWFFPMGSVAAKAIAARLPTVGAGGLAAALPGLSGFQFVDSLKGLQPFPFLTERPENVTTFPVTPTIGQTETMVPPPVDAQPKPTPQPAPLPTGEVMVPPRVDMPTILKLVAEAPSLSPTLMDQLADVLAQAERDGRYDIVAEANAILEARGATQAQKNYVAQETIRRAPVVAEPIEAPTVETTIEAPVAAPVAVPTPTPPMAIPTTPVAPFGEVVAPEAPPSEAPAEPSPAPGPVTVEPLPEPDPNIWFPDPRTTPGPSYPDTGPMPVKPTPAPYVPPATVEPVPEPAKPIPAPPEWEQPWAPPQVSPIAPPEPVPAPVPPSEPSPAPKEPGVIDWPPIGPDNPPQTVTPVPPESPVVTPPLEWPIVRPTPVPVPTPKPTPGPGLTPVPTPSPGTPPYEQPVTPPEWAPEPIPAPVPAPTPTPGEQPEPIPGPQPQPRPGPTPGLTPTPAPWTPPAEVPVVTPVTPPAWFPQPEPVPSPVPAPLPQPRPTPSPSPGQQPAPAPTPTPGTPPARPGTPDVPATPRTSPDGSPPRLPRFRLPNNQTLPEGIYPRVVSWPQGTVDIIRDLDTGATSYQPRTGRIDLDPLEGFRVVATDKTPPREEMLDQGLFAISVTRNGLSFRLKPEYRSAYPRGTLKPSRKLRGRM